MDVASISIIAAVLAGTGAGIVLTWVMLRTRARDGADKIRASAAAEMAQMRARQEFDSQQIDELKQACMSAKGEIESLRIALNAEIEKRSAAEERMGRIPALEAEARELRQANSAIESSNKRLETLLGEKEKAVDEKLTLLNSAEQKLLDAFKSLSAQALQSNNEQFLQLANTNLQNFQENAQGDLQKRTEAIAELVKPLKESLEKVTRNVEEVEKSRIKATSAVEEQLKSLALTHDQLRATTANIAGALRAPTARGRWGEVQLERVLNLAQLSENIHYERQVTAVDDDGARQRPDIIVKLPGNKNLVVDSKVPLTAYLNAIEAQDDGVKQDCLKRHAREVAAHVYTLSGKEYWKRFNPSPEYVVMFLPGDAFLSAALEKEPNLFLESLEARVILTTPGTLMALLNAVSYTWNQERIEKNAEEISRLGQQLYERICKLAEHFDDVRKALNKATESYNKSVGTLESRVLVTARKFKELGASRGTEIETIESVEVIARTLQAEEFTGLHAPDDISSDGHDDDAASEAVA